MSLVGILAILSLSFGVEGWRIDTAQFKGGRAPQTFHGKRVYWNDLMVWKAAFVIDSRAYTINRLSPTRSYGVRSDGYRNDEMYFLSSLGYFGAVDKMGTFYLQPVAWTRLGTCKSIPSRNGEPSGKFKIENLNTLRTFFQGSDTFKLFREPFAAKDTDIDKMFGLFARFDALKRQDGYVFGRIFWRQMAQTQWTKWRAFGKQFDTVPISDDRDFYFSRESGSDGNLWKISEQVVRNRAMVMMKFAGLLLPRNSHSSCFADSLGGWYYEACGDFPASPILEYKSVAVKQQPGQKITPWGRMTWEVRGKKTGWFLPRGQHFLPRVFRTDKAPKVDDFWATPPKGVP